MVDCGEIQVDFFYANNESKLDLKLFEQHENPNAFIVKETRDERYLDLYAINYKISLKNYPERVAEPSPFNPLLTIEFIDPCDNPESLTAPNDPSLPISLEYTITQREI